LASLGLVAVKAFLVDRTLATTFRFTTFIGWDVVLWTIPIVLLVGILLAVSAASITLRRYLRV
jgi:cell division transport system permease protein